MQHTWIGKSDTLLTFDRYVIFCEQDRMKHEYVHGQWAWAASRIKERSFMPPETLTIQYTNHKTKYSQRNIENTYICIHIHTNTYTYTYRLGCIGLDA